MKVADQRHVDAHAVELLADMGHRLRRFGRVDRDAHQLRARQRQFLDLDRRLDRVDRVGVCHRLHTHRGVAADGDHAAAPAHFDLARAARCRARRFDEIIQSGSTFLHGHARCYLSSNRATLSRVCGNKSKG